MARQPDPAKREMIIKSAIELFLEKGYRNSSVAEIGGRAGIRASNVYIYFENKEALLLATVRRMMDEHTAFFLELSEKSVGLEEKAFAVLCFDELEKIRPRILFMMRCVITPTLAPLFENFDFDYSEVFVPYFEKWPEAYRAALPRILMALADSYFLVGDKENITEAVANVIKTAREAWMKAS